MGNDEDDKHGYYDLVDSLANVTNTYGRTCGSRTRCTSMKSLMTLLQWYTSKKFSESHCTHIDRHPWDDMTADFDPRVFQGFVWASDQQHPQQNNTNNNNTEMPRQ